MKKLNDQVKEKEKSKQPTKDVADDLFIDDLFEKKKKKDTLKKQLKEETKKDVKIKRPAENEFLAENKKRKWTEDGLLVYDAEELSIGTGGDTEDCPFDCWCCF